MKKLLTIVFLWIATYPLSAQNYQAGFELLEKGEFEQAASFFDKAIQENPNNKTAKLCYARAIGLFNNPQKAESIFRELLLNYPSDYEVELNLAEALMWQKEFAAADSMYQYLVAKDTSNFVANLGLANASTNLKKHTIALQAIEKALQIDAKNSGALISKKYIYLAYADNLRSQKQYTLSHKYLDEINHIFPNDKDILLTKATVFLNQKKPRAAIKIYDNLIKNKLALVQAYNGKSYCNTILQQTAKAVKYANLSVQNIDAQTPQNVAFDAQINQLNTLALKNNFAQANKVLTQLNSLNPNNLPLQLANARLDAWQWKFADAQAKYLQLMKQEGQKTPILVEYADALSATNQPKQAIEILQQVVAQDTTLTDIEWSLQQLQRQQKSYINTQNNWASDAGGNLSFNTQNNFHLVHNPNRTSLVGVDFRWAGNSNKDLNNNKAQTFIFWVGQAWQPHYRVKISAQAGLFSFKNLLNQQKNSLQVKTLAQIALSKWQQVELGYNKSQFNYNAQLIFSEIGTHDFTLTHHIYSPLKIGWFTQIISTPQTDKNHRNLVYSALYYNILQVPILKLGLTFNWFNYKNQIPDLYFSPKNFTALAFFAQFHNLDKTTDQLKYQIMGAIGSQKIDQNERQATQLLDLKLGYNFAHNYLLMAQYLYSSAAQENIAGFSFHQIGLQGKFIF